MGTLYGSPVIVVAIPFKDEDDSVVLKNLEIAASHASVDRVWGVCAPDHRRSRLAANLNPSLPIDLVPETRIGTYRAGKGDAMNTAIRLASERSVHRLHFYDADITNFGHEWITGAETAANLGYEVVRHSFPRAATDAMITWMITKPVLAMRFPGTLLPAIGQPLGGELLLGSNAIETMASSDQVRARSDWGIDTLLTFAAVAGGHSLYEHHVSDGKRHALYGSLGELRTMAIECFDAVRSLPQVVIPDIQHTAEPPSAIPDDLSVESGYSPEATLPSLVQPWEPGEHELASQLPSRLSADSERLVGDGEFDFLDESAWEEILRFMIQNFSLGDRGSEALLFRLWVGRVLNYTLNYANRGYGQAMSYLRNNVLQYEMNTSKIMG